MTTGEFVTGAEAAALVNRPVNTVRGWAFRGLLVHRGWRLVGNSWARLYDPNEVRAVAAEMDAAPRANRARPTGREREPSEDELERTIAEQRAQLPAWWPKRER